MPGGLNGYPQVFLFDKNGQLVWRKKGYLQGDELKMLEEVKKLN
jgi:thioredoxin-related protein